MRRIVGTIALLLLAGVFAVPALEQDQAKPQAVSHEVERRDRCMMCHRAGAMELVPDAPASHAERTNDTCMLCHAPGSAMLTTTAPAVSHSLEGRNQCMECHEAGATEAIPDAPSGHEAIDLEYCTMCHQVAV